VIKIQQVIQDIKNAEIQADQVVEEAKKARDIILKQARQKANDTLVAKHEEIAKDRDKRRQDYEKAMEEKKKKLLDKAGQEIKEMKDKSVKKQSKAIDFIMKKFWERFNA
jgi:V/A-type H+-transporting ATPase subunit G/H